MHVFVNPIFRLSLFVIYMKIILNSLRSSYTEARESLFREIDALSLIITIYFFPLPVYNIESFRKISFDLRARPRISLDISNLRGHDIKRLIKAGLRIRNCYVSGGDRTVKKSIDARRTVGVGPRTAGLDIGRREKEISIENRG